MGPLEPALDVSDSGLRTSNDPTSSFCAATPIYILNSKPYYDVVVSGFFFRYFPLAGFGSNPKPQTLHLRWEVEAPSLFAGSLGPSRAY